jgi:hypothetical protein
METRGEGATVRPWFWIICLFIGPMLVSVAFQDYLYLTSRIAVHLVLEHSLRVRLVAEDPDKKSGDVPGTACTAPDDASEDGQSSPSRESLENTAVDFTALESKTATKDSSSTKTAPSVALKKEQNLIEKINNLATTDALTITNARDFLQVGVIFLSATKLVLTRV